MDQDKFGSKIYCCSNSTRSEAKKLAIFDIIGSLAALAFASWTTEMVKNHTEYFKNITDASNATFTDLGFILNFEVEDQNFFFAGTLIWCGWSVVLGGTLLYAAQMYKQGLLKVWLGLTLLIIFVGLFAVVLAVVLLARKIVIGAICFMVYLYKWYEIWIIYRLIKEFNPGSTTSVKKGSAAGHDGGDNPGVIIVSPSPDPDAVYTIDGQLSQPQSPKLNPHKSSEEKLES